MTYMGDLNGAFIDTAMITSVLKANEKKKKAGIKRRRQKT